MTRLRKVSASQRGWTRRRAGRGFTYLDADGLRLKATDVDRIRALVIPPAWRDVWICPVANGHLQAVGTDDAGRRQYLYHPDWRIRRDTEKFERVMTLGAALPRIRKRILDDLDAQDMSMDRACALAVRLLDLGFFRIGDDTYAEEYGSFGLTTLERSHLRLTKSEAVFEFIGKSGVEHQVTVDDAQCVEALRLLRRRRGGVETLLAHKSSGRWCRIEGTVVNDYLREVSGLEVTAKDFRTWHGTVLAAIALAETDETGQSKASRNRAVKAAMDEVAGFLGNTPTVARNSYVDPRVIDYYDKGEVIRVRRSADDTPSRFQERAERAVLRLLT